MIVGDIKNKKIARKYSRALLETTSKEGLEKKVLDDLFFIKELINTNKELSNLLNNPVVSVGDKKEIISRILADKIDKITLDFIMLLIDNNRINAFMETVSQYLSSYNKLKGIVTPVIISAVELNEIQKNKVTEKLKNKLSKTIQPQYQVDSDIIGGLIIEIDDKTLDFSLKSKFDNMKKELTKGNRYGNN